VFKKIIDIAKLKSRQIQPKEQPVKNMLKIIGGGTTGNGGVKVDNKH
jgi:hypothetical protein